MVPVVIIGGLVFMVVKGKQKKQERTTDFMRFAQETGMCYIGGASLANIPNAKNFYIFTRGFSDFDFHSIQIGKNEKTKIENLVTGSISGYQVSIFDFTYRMGGGSGKVSIGFGGGGHHHGGHHNQPKYYHQTVVMLESPRLNLPTFTMRPEGFWQELGKAFGGQDINFASHPVFSKNYLLKGANEAHIRHVFNPRVLTSLQPTTGLSIEADCNRLLYYRHKTRIPSNQLRPIINEAVSAANLFMN